MTKVKFLEDHRFADKGKTIELDEQIADTFNKIGIVEIIVPETPLKKGIAKENALANNNIENAAFN